MLPSAKLVAAKLLRPLLRALAAPLAAAALAAAALAAFAAADVGPFAVATATQRIVRIVLQPAARRQLQSMCCGL